VKALVTTGDSVLLVRERHADGSPFWTLPGGGVHAGERPAAAVERELREELRCGCVVGDPIDAFPYAHTSRPAVSLYTVYECRLVSEPTPVAAEGVHEYRWVTPTSIPARTLPQVRAIAERTCLSRR
jgi:8-oxo-dGTP diphosphatase